MRLVSLESRYSGDLLWVCDYRGGGLRCTAATAKETTATATATATAAATATATATAAVVISEPTEL